MANFSLVVAACQLMSIATAQQVAEKPKVYGPEALPSELGQLEKRIVIHIGEQTLTAYDKGLPYLVARCSTGRNNATPKGEFRIRQKLRYNRALPKFGGMEIPFSLRLDIVKGGKRRLIAIHAHPNVPRRPASHGCIRLRHADARKLFSWAEVGLKVSIE